MDRAIYELHIRDFSATDESVPEDLRGTYLAFAQKSAGTDQLKQLAGAGINTVHLLPSFDIASIEEDPAAAEDAGVRSALASGRLGSAAGLHRRGRGR